MNVIFKPDAWSQYLEWQKLDKRMIVKINSLIKDIERNGFSVGMGKPEILKGRKEFSRRINLEHRLIYISDDNNNLLIISCMGHYTNS